MVKFTTQEPIEEPTKLASTQSVKANTTSFRAVLQFCFCIAAWSLNELKATSSFTSVPCDLGHGLVPNNRYQREPGQPRSFLPGSAESLCGSEIQKFERAQDLKAQKFDNYTMSNYGGYQENHYGRHLDLRPRCELVILCKDNSNQGAWTESIDRHVRSNGTMKFMLKKFNEHRQLDIINDLAVDGPLKDALVKIEETETAQRSEL